MPESNEPSFKVTTIATVSVEMDVEVKANDSFNDAKSTAESAVSRWFDDMFRDYAPQKWPYPSRKGVTVEINDITGKWTKEPKGKGENK